MPISTTTHASNTLDKGRSAGSTTPEGLTMLNKLNLQERVRLQGPRAIQVLAAVATTLIMLAGCSSEDGSGDDDTGADVGADSIVADVDDAGTTDTAESDIAVDVTFDAPALVCPPEPRTYGADCETGEDCVSGYCAPSATGGVCTELCAESCLSFCGDTRAVCRGMEVDGAIAFACMPADDVLCRACVTDAQCAGGTCLTFEDGTTACGTGCEADFECPVGYRCGDGTSATDGQCVPLSGSCSCGPDSEGLERPCRAESEFGSCAGVEVCAPAAGWSTCDAAPATAEVCDGEDNNCDGVIDNGAEVGSACAIDNEFGRCEGIEICRGAEGLACLGEPASEELCDGLDNDCNGTVDDPFTTDGVYDLTEHCGGCGLSCDGRFAFADSVACDASSDGPRCVVTSCAEGYAPVGDLLCQPLQPTLCLPCEADVDCSLSSPGARCVTQVDASDPSRESQICGRDCSVDGVFGAACPAGYACSAIAGGADQCLPVAGTCACIDAPDGFSVPCTVSAMSELTPGGELVEISCGGLKGCEGEGFGACSLSDDICDGFDNDCDGLIDNAFRDGAGVYATNEDCGRCGNDCTQRFTEDGENATGICSGVGRCEMVCLDGFVDLVNGTDDGCECELRDGDDEPDADPSLCDGSCDLNCDGIDGNVSAALFVSRTGEDSDAGGTIDAPLGSLGVALQRATDCRAGTATGYCPGTMRDIYVATGVYSENVELVAGVSVYGGYSLDFVQRDSQANPTTIFGVAPSGSEIGTVTAREIDARTKVSGFSIYGSPASSAGQSTYAVYIVDSTDRLVLSDSVIVAANAANGAPGVRGASGDSASNGTSGNLGRSSSQLNCSVTPTVGGQGGASTCGSLGGGGGQALCPSAQSRTGGICVSGNNANCFNSCEEVAGCGALPPVSQGVGGIGASNGGCSGPTCGTPGEPAYDFWSSVGSSTSTVCNQCGNQVGLRHIGGDAASGRPGVNGGGGAGSDTASGFIDDDGLWVPFGGRDGQANATAGGGGGGGSAGAGYDVVGTGFGGCVDNLGGSGGGGGGGGCAGSPGGAGSSGGSSFAIFVLHTRAAAGTPMLENNAVFRGRGGAGGNGGNG
ncbi:MAG: hypothetical protein ACJA1R_001483, partial [Flavobacteriales bacterium]